MGGSAGGGDNAQILSLLSQYGGDGTVAAPAKPTQEQMQRRFQKSFEDYMKSHPNGSTGIFAGFSAVDGAGRRARGGGGGGVTPPTTGGPGPMPNNSGTGMEWQFPQYTQTWAFTPPTPPPYNYPSPFDPAKYGNPLKAKQVKKNT